MVILLINCSPEQESGPAGPPTNIILLMGDDHGWEETGYNGHPFLHTPVLDEMAATGLRLDRFYSASPVCSPTRGSVITGRHPNRYGTFTPNWSIRPEEISVAHLLKQAGYHTGHFGKWHLGPVKAASPTNPGAMGFDTWLSHDNFFEIDPVLSRDGGVPEQFRGESSEILIEETIRFIETAKENGQPFFGVVWFGSPHEPYSGLDQDLALYQDLPDSLEKQMVSLTSMETGLPVDRPLKEVLQERYAEITAMDRAIGNLRQYLAEQGLKQHTVLWYCGDNGVPTSGIYNPVFRGVKGNVYDEGIRVPGVIEWPEGIPAPMQSAVNSVTSDILPTLCEIAGIPVPERPLDGISLVPLMRGNMDKRPAPVYFWNFDTGHEARDQPYIDPQLQVGTTPLVKVMDGVYTRSFTNFHHTSVQETDFNGARAILDHQYKLVIDGHNGATLELFDMVSDPTESNNLADSRPQIVEKMSEQLREWQQSVLKSLTGADYL
jgi:arylsulfatase A-like enzyme